jgi:3-methylcrotonyl-CoA carboxylase alpha subunit
MENFMKYSKEIEIDGQKQECQFLRTPKGLWLNIKGETFFLERKNLGTRGKTQEFKEGPLTSPMPGKIMKIFAKAGSVFEEKQSLLVLEAMKMEYTIKVPAKVKIEKVLVSEGEQVKEGQVLLEVKKADG